MKVPFLWYTFGKRVMKMENKKQKKSFGKQILLFCCFAILIGAFIFLGTRNYSVKEIPDNQLFQKEYKNVRLDNSFHVFNSVECLTFLEKETGILFLGFPENEWSHVVAEMLDTASLEMGFQYLNYFNFYLERERRHDNYLGILREIDENLRKNDKGKLDLYAPTVIGVARGNVVFFDDETTFSMNNDTIKSYWTSEKKREKIELYKQVMRQINEELS